MSLKKWKRLELPAPVLIEARGPDALRYLNGQMTQDLRLVASSGNALPACVTDAKARLQFRVWIHPAAGGAIRVSCDHDGAEGLFARLDRYLIADDATLEDISVGWTRIHVTGAESPECPDGAYLVRINRIGIEGWDIWLPESASKDSLVHLDCWNFDEAESLRITAGIPAWGSELNADLLPPEAGLDRTDVSYSKGCYIGQEVISRIRSAGKVNRRLMRMTLDASVSCQAGDLLVDGEGKEAGLVTSVAPLAVNGTRTILAYLKRTAEDREVHLKENPAGRLVVLGRA